MKRFLMSVASILALVYGVAAHADALADIKQRGTLICGTLGTAPPFSFQDPKTREIVGYDVDFCKGIAEALKVKLQIKLIAVDARIPELLQGRVDVIAANLGYTPQRAEQIDFSDAYFAGPSKLLVRKDANLSSLSQMDTKRIAVVKGSSAEPAVRKLLPKASVISYPDPTSGFLAIMQHKVDGLCASELALVKMQRQTDEAVPLAIIDQPVYSEQWGIGVRKNESALREAVDHALEAMERSGEAGVIFDKWLGASSEYKIRRDFKIVAIKG
ncbi:ABC transporter substrate-binding protein [Paraburkholderia sp. JHI869]|uniref:ABC transporter substrate-binding protein n=1 Tax=Paraburkholderia sp. JHI869 TaxID=3112959 RepID=UPI0031729371